MFRYLCFTLTSLTLSIFQGVTYLLLHFFQAFKETSILFSIEVLLICISNNSIYALAFLHIFSSICCFFYYWCLLHKIMKCIYIFFMSIMYLTSNNSNCPFKSLLCCPDSYLPLLKELPSILFLYMYKAGFFIWE